MYVLNIFDALHISVDREWVTVGILYCSSSTGKCLNSNYEITMILSEFQLAYGGAMSAGNLSVTLLLKYTGKRLLGIVSVFSTSLTSIALGAYVYYKDRLQMPWLFIFLLFLLTFVGSHCKSLPFLMMGEVFSVKLVQL